MTFSVCLAVLAGMPKRCAMISVNMSLSIWAIPTEY